MTPALTVKVRIDRVCQPSYVLSKLKTVFSSFSRSLPEIVEIPLTQMSMSSRPPCSCICLWPTVRKLRRVYRSRLVAVRYSPHFGCRQFPVT